MGVVMGRRRSSGGGARVDHILYERKLHSYTADYIHYIDLLETTYIQYQRTEVQLQVLTYIMVHLLSIGKSPKLYIYTKFRHVLCQCCYTV